MTSETAICNAALAKIGEREITSLADDNPPAKAMSKRYARLRDLELSRSVWRFAVEIAQLTADGAAPTFGYSQRFAMPSDSLRPLLVGNIYAPLGEEGVHYTAAYAYAAPRPHFEIIGQYVHTDLAAPLEFTYVKRITDPTRFSDLFIEALASKLAWDAVDELTNSPGRQDRAKQDYADAMSAARMQNALWRPPRQRRSGAWVRSRRYG
ncbi:MAG: hypothetical protein AAFR28_06320 [Pseudomonadota bacterium]